MLRLSKLRIHLALVLTALGVLLASVPARAGQTYTITDLGTLTGGTVSEGNVINASGVVAGIATDASGNYSPAAFQNGTVTNLGTLGGISGGAYGINNAGDIVGSSALSPQNSGIQNAFLWNPTTQMIQNLGTLGGSQSVAEGINNSNVIVGQSSVDANSPYHAFAYYGGVMHDLGTFVSGGASYANAINDSGIIAGTAYITDNQTGNPQHAMMITLQGHFTDLGTLATGTISVGMGINSSNEIIGYSTIDQSAGGPIHAFAYYGGSMHDLGTLGGASSVANGINDQGVIVGYSNVSFGNHAFIDQNGVMTDLNSLIATNSGWTLESAGAINDAGQITGYGFINGQTHAFLLTATSVPEPGSAVLLGFGAVSLAVACRRRHARLS